VVLFLELVQLVKRVEKPSVFGLADNREFVVGHSQDKHFLFWTSQPIRALWRTVTN